MTIAEIKQFVYDFLYDKGLPHISICAVMGNIQAESGFDPNIVEVGNSIGFGLCQWSFGRRDQLEAYGTSLQHQCEFLWSELTGQNTTTTGADFQWISNPADSVDNGEGFYCSNETFIQGQGTLAFLTTAFCYCWERPAYATNHLSTTRIPSATDYYNSMSYNGSGGGVIPDPDPDEPDPDEPEPDEPENIIKKKQHYKFVLFNQRRVRTWRNKTF